MIRWGCMLVAVLAALPVHADTIHNIATGLDYAGFDARGSRNPLSGGIDLLINRQFNGNVFDFGAPELALQGPVSLQVSTGGRVIPGIDVSLTTALNDRSQAVPLNYNYSSGMGAQSTTVTGSMLVDASFSMNALGFYDLNITSSSRNTVTRDGVASSSNNVDSDIGPLSVSGNIFIDALAAVTDPLFEQSGAPNPFSALSKTVGNLHDVGFSGPDGTPRGLGLTRSAHAVVPEPTVLVMMLVGGPLLLWCSRRSR